MKMIMMMMMMMMKKEGPEVESKKGEGGKVGGEEILKAEDQVFLIVIFVFHFV